MNYRHAFHAGNFADVLKHAVLALAIEHAKLKPAPLRVIDTHAGVGRYDLGSGEAMRTGEWRHGIGRLLGPDAEAIPADVAAILDPYLAVVRNDNASGPLRTYPGSPLLARRLLRPQDRLLATELHPQEFAHLQHTLGRDPQVKTIALDGWQGLQAFLPPPERRGIVMIDPPYEERHELDGIVTHLGTASRRFPGGVFIVWYPIKDGTRIERFHDALAALGIPKLLRVELLVRAPLDTRVLNGCGLILVNPPWSLSAQLERLLPFLVDRLALAPGGGQRLQWIAE